MKKILLIVVLLVLGGCKVTTESEPEFPNTEGWWKEV